MRLLAVDGNSILNRAYYGIRPLTTKDGQFTHAIYGFLTMLEKIIYIADYIEPGRNQAPNLELIRKLAFEDLDECLYQILKDTLDYLNASGMEIDSSTRETFDYYKEQRGKNHEFQGNGIACD